jgi:hypothetical protein
LGIWVAVGIFEKSSRLRIARFSLGMFTPDPGRSGAQANQNMAASRAGARVLSAPAEYGK